MKRFFLIFFTVLFVFFSFSPLCFSFSASSYSDLAQSSTQANNLLSFAENYKSFSNSDFVIVHISQYDYRIFWGDLNYNGSSVTGNKVEYIQYVREGVNYDYQYHYRYGTDETLSLSVNHLVVSNIEELGSRSSLYEEYQYYDLQLIFFIFITAVLIAVLFLFFRSVYK